MKQELLYGVDFEGSSLLHLAIDSGVLKVKIKKANLAVGDSEMLGRNPITSSDAVSLSNRKLVRARA